MPDKTLWSLSKGEQVAAAELRQVEGVGLELRFVWNGELVHGQIYRDVQELLSVAHAKRDELQARGWTAPAAGA
jgi:hypothetical protein